MQQKQQKKIKYGLFGLLGLVVVLLGIAVVGGFGYNVDYEWQIVQRVGGDVVVRDNPGWYLRWFATVTEYPRAITRQFAKAGKGDLETSAKRAEDESIRITFNDTATAQISCIVRFELPTEQDKRRLLHRQFAGNKEAITQSVRSNINQIAKATSPLMSSTEHVSARKAEYAQLVREQLDNGIYRMRQIEKQYKDVADATGNSITVLATEIIRDVDGNPIVAQESPLSKYGIRIAQFSIEDTDYDSKTLEKFDAKRDSLLLGEQFKAEREQEVQERLMIVERGLKNKAIIEADAKALSAKAVIEAERDKEVAILVASKNADVAMQVKIEAETKGAQFVAVAALELEQQKLMTQSADEQAKQIILLAAAEEERIEKAGAITEEAQVLAQIAADRDVAVARELSKVAVPGVVIAGGSGSGSGGGSDVLSSLIQMVLLRQSGVLPNGGLDPALAKVSSNTGE